MVEIDVPHLFSTISRASKAREIFFGGSKTEGGGGSYKERVQ